MTRIVIEGEPGSGKTTFTKAVCKAWMAGLKPNLDGENNPEGHYIASRFSVLLAFILRLVTTECTLFDLISEQYGFLTCSEVCAIIRLIQNEPNQVCLIFDGFDEWNQTEDLRNTHLNQLLNIIAKSEGESLLCITTSRSYGVRQLQRYNSKAIQAYVKLCGFNERQVRQYISLYFKLNSDADSPMTRQIKDHNLWKLASIPIRLQMMCFVWKKSRKLGKNCAQLYHMLLLGLLDHMERREGGELTPEKHIMAKYHETVLLPTSNLANRWDRKGNLNILFSLQDIKETCGEPKQHVMDFITKYFPSSTMTKSLWSFTHLSLQEYFVAYHVVYTETGLDEFLNKCYTLRALEKYQVIVESICSLAPQKSNEIISSVVGNISHTENDCIQMLTLILLFMEAYESLSSVNIPLPSLVVLGEAPSSGSVNWSHFKPHYLSYLFNNDFKLHKNMTSLKVHQLDMLPDEVNINYVTALSLVVKEERQLEKGHALLSQLSNKTEILEIEFQANTLKSLQIKSVMDCIRTNNISVFSIKGSGIIPVVSNIIEKQPKLTFLSINDTDNNHNTGINYFQAICEAANRSKNLKELRTGGIHLGSCLRMLKSSIKITVCTRYNTDSEIVKFCEEIVSVQPNITKVDLSFSNFGCKAKRLLNPGKLIGQIMLYLPTLTVLKLRKCGLSTETLAQVETEILSSKKPVCVQELDLLGNRLLNFDSERLMDCCPSLKVLLVTYGNKGILPRKHHKMKVLVATGSEQNTVPLSFSDGVCFLEKLYIIYATIDFEEINQRKSLSYNLKILHVMDAPYPETTIQILSKILLHMNYLEELHFTTTQSENTIVLKAVISLVNNLPPSVTHLNICGYESAELIHILDEKLKLKALQTLNIGSSKTDAETIQIIRQELQELHSEIDVYYNPEESLISMLSYSSISPSSIINMKSVQEANNLFSVIK